MTITQEQLELGQFIPLHYHYNMLNDRARMEGFKTALDRVVRPGARVLELARRILALNPFSHAIEVVEADACRYLLPEPVDVVICEMLHVGLLREKQVDVIASFKERDLERFGGPLPAFVPEAVV